MAVIRVMPPSARYSYTRLACCRPERGRARGEFSIWTIAGPRRVGVGVGVALAVGGGDVPQAESRGNPPARPAQRARENRVTRRMSIGNAPRSTAVLASSVMLPHELLQSQVQVERSL